MYGLTAQLRRAAVSVPTNIVEGFKRRSKREYLYFIAVAVGSLEETKYQMLLSRDLGYIDGAAYGEVMLCCEEVGRMLCGFQKCLLRCVA